MYTILKIENEKSTVISQHSFKKDALKAFRSLKSYWLSKLPKDKVVEYAPYPKIKSLLVNSKCLYIFLQGNSRH